MEKGLNRGLAIPDFTFPASIPLIEFQPFCLKIIFSDIPRYFLEIPDFTLYLLLFSYSNLNPSFKNLFCPEIGSSQKFLSTCNSLLEFQPFC